MIHACRLADWEHEREQETACFKNTGGRGLEHYSRQNEWADCAGDEGNKLLGDPPD